MSQGIAYDNSCLPGYFGETPGISALIAHYNNDCFFRHLSASDKWGLLTFLTCWQWYCTEESGSERIEYPILTALAEFEYCLSDEVEALINILAQYNPEQKDAHILINALVNQIDRSIYAQ